MRFQWGKVWNSIVKHKILYNDSIYIFNVNTFRAAIPHKGTVFQFYNIQEGILLWCWNTSCTSKGGYWLHPNSHWILPICTRTYLFHYALSSVFDYSFVYFIMSTQWFTNYSNTDHNGSYAKLVRWCVIILSESVHACFVLLSTINAPLYIILFRTGTQGLINYPWFPDPLACIYIYIYTDFMLSIWPL